MWKFLFKPFISPFEYIVIIIGITVINAFSFWLGLFVLIIGAIIQVMANLAIRKDIEIENVQE